MGQCQTYLVVRHAMVVEIRGGGERLLADLADMWLFAGVDSSVGVERRGC